MNKKDITPHYRNGIFKYLYNYNYLPGWNKPKINKQLTGFDPVIIFNRYAVRNSMREALK